MLQVAPTTKKEKKKKKQHLKYAINTGTCYFALAAQHSSLEAAFKHLKAPQTAHEAFSVLDTRRNTKWKRFNKQPPDGKKYLLTGNI